MAQINTLETNSDKTVFRPLFDIRVNSGVSIPIGKYRMLTDESDDRSSAGLGVYTEIMSSFPPLTSSPWRIGLTLGYMHHPFESDKSKTYFDLPIFEASPWNSYYALLGVGFISKSKFLYGINISAGILAYSGGNIKSGSITIDTLTVREWSYSTETVAAIKGTASFGYNITPKFSIFGTVSILYAAAIREGELNEEDFLADAQNTAVYPSFNEQNSNVQNQTTIFVINCGLGFRYKFYDIADDFNYKLNLEENQ